jgi:hypothetical protein
MNLSKGQFYEFERRRNVARAGQPEHLVEGIEIGFPISDETAFHNVKLGRDVYTVRESDAWRLATKIEIGTKPSERHLPKKETRSRRIDVYFRHYHPGNDHGYGHIFFGSRGDGEATTPE